MFYNSRVLTMRRDDVSFSSFMKYLWFDLFEKY